MGQHGIRTIYSKTICQAQLQVSFVGSGMHVVLVPDRTTSKCQYWWRGVAWADYSLQVNRRIESAFQEGRQAVEFQNDKNHTNMRVDFVAMQQTSSVSGKAR